MKYRHSNKNNRKSLKGTKKRRGGSLKDDDTTKTLKKNISRLYTLLHKLYTINAAIKKNSNVDSTQCNIETIKDDIKNLETIYENRDGFKTQLNELYKHKVLSDVKIDTRIAFLKEHFFIQRNKTEPDYKTWFDRIEKYCKSYIPPVVGSPPKTKKTDSKTKKISPPQTKPDSPSSKKTDSPSPKKKDSKTKKISPSQTKPKPEPATATEYNFDDILNIVFDMIKNRPNCLDANLNDLNSFFNANKISSKDRYKIIIHILLDNIENNRCIPETENETANPNNTLINEIETNYTSLKDQKLDAVKKQLRVKILVNSEIRKYNEKQREEQERKEQERKEQEEQRKKQEEEQEEEQRKKQRKKQEEHEKTDVPDWAFDIFGQGIINDPILTPSGRCYERKDLLNWIRTKHTDPLTRKPLTENQLREPDDEFMTRLNALKAKHIK